MFRAQTKDLIKACAVLLPIADRNPVVPAYGNIRIYPEDKEYGKLTASNGQIEASIRIPMSANQVIQVDAQLFGKTVSAFAGTNEIVFTKAPDENILIIKEGKKKAAIPFDADPTYPIMNMGELSLVGDINPEKYRMFSAMASMINEDDPRESLRTGKILVRGEEAFLEATDSYNLVRTKIGENMNTEMLQLSKAMMMIISSFGSTPCTLHESARGVSIECDNVTYSMIGFSGKYTDTNAFFATMNPEKYMRFDSEDLMDGLKFVTPYADKDRVVSIQSKPEECAFLTSDDGVGTAANYKFQIANGYKSKIAINGKYLAKIFPMFAGNVNIQVEDTMMFMADRDTWAVLRGLTM